MMKENVVLCVDEKEIFSLLVKSLVMCARACLCVYIYIFALF